MIELGTGLQIKYTEAVMFHVIQLTMKNIPIEIFELWDFPREWCPAGQKEKVW